MIKAVGRIVRKGFGFWLKLAKMRWVGSITKVIVEWSLRKPCCKGDKGMSVFICEYMILSRTFDRDLTVDVGL